MKYHPSRVRRSRVKAQDDRPSIRRDIMRFHLDFQPSMADHTQLPHDEIPNQLPTFPVAFVARDM
jgi:hypothetical protein